MANATVTVLEADGVTQTDVVVLDVGRQAAAASKSIAMSTEDKAVLDAMAASLAIIDNASTAVTTINGVAPAFGSGATGATVLRTVLATDSPGIYAAGLADGASSLSVVLAKDSIKYVTVDMTAETTALDAGDVVAATQIVAACTPANDAPGLLQSIVVIDPDDQGAELNLVFFSANTTLGTEDAAPDIDDTEVLTVIGVINVATTDYVDLGLSKVATLRNVGLPVLPATGTDDIFVAIFTPGTPTYAGGNIRLRLGFM